MSSINGIDFARIIEGDYLGRIAIGIMSLDVFRTGFKGCGPVAGPFAFINLSSQFLKGMLVQVRFQFSSCIDYAVSDDGGSP